jgi:hypothetical protein
MSLCFSITSRIQGGHDVEGGHHHDEADGDPMATFSSQSAEKRLWFIMIQSVVR